MLWRCRLKMRPSISFVASSARCSFPTAHLAYREAKRVLKPGGHFLFSVWDRIEENDFADDVTNALARIFPNDPPRFMARTPHGYHDTALIRSELEDGRFLPCGDRDESRTKPCILAAHSGRRLLSGNSSSQRNRGQRRGKTGSCNRLRRIRDCEQTWQRRGCCQNSGTRNRGCGLNIGMSAFWSTADVPHRVFYEYTPLALFNLVHAVRIKRQVAGDLGHRRVRLLIAPHRVLR